MSRNFTNSPVRTYPLIVAGTEPNLAYKVTSRGGYAQIVELYAANVSTGQADITIKYYQKLTDSLFTIVNEDTVIVNGGKTFGFDGLSMNEGDEIRVTQKAENTFHFFTTVVEHPGRSG